MTRIEDPGSLEEPTTPSWISWRRSKESGHSHFRSPRAISTRPIGIVHLKRIFTPRSRSSTRLADLAQSVPVVPSTLDGDALMAQISAKWSARPALVADRPAVSPAWSPSGPHQGDRRGSRDEHDEETPDICTSAACGVYQRASCVSTGSRRDRFPARASGGLRDDRRPGHACRSRSPPGRSVAVAGVRSRCGHRQAA